MPPKRKSRGLAARSPSKRIRGATSTRDDFQPTRPRTAASAEIALSTATMEQLLWLSAGSLRSHLKAYALSSSGNKAAMASRLYNYFHTSGITSSTNSGNSSAHSSVTTRTRGQSSTAVSDSVEMPPCRVQENSDNSIIAANSTAVAAPLSHSIPPPRENEGQLLSSQDLSSNLPVQLAHQLTNLFRQFMPVARRENESAGHSGRALQPATVNNCSINNQSQVPGNSVITTTGQMPSSSLQPVQAINQPVVANNLPLLGSNQLEPTDEVLSAASPTQPLTLTANPHPIDHTSQPCLMQPLPMNSNVRGIIMDPLQQSLPPVPARIKERIIKGEYIDFTTLLPKAMLSSSVEPDHPGSLTLQLPSGPSDFTVHPTVKGRKVTSFSSWMEAWNVYLAIRVDHTPSCAPSLIAYQRIITSASVSYSLQSWLNYDVQFRMLAASNPSLRWDTRHPDLWLQCLTTAGTQQSNRWPCPFCGATTHFPNRCPFRANSPTHLPSEQRNDSGRQSSGTSRSFTLANDPPSTPRQTYCRDFNYRTCKYIGCKFAHACEHCGANHPVKNCPRAGPMRSTR